ncbi:MAG: hypothetical protein K0R61_134 [Microvirga sp.]|jgi:hypothetical protein|nr:hypothetical protein [Microvirga sp.]
MTAFLSFRAFRKTVRTSYAQAFKLWAEGEARRWQARHPDRIPFPVHAFDGCTVGLDVCRPCCLEHDIAVWYARTADERARADDAFRVCVVSIGDDEDRFGRAWNGIGAIYWLAVRARTEWLKRTGKLP